ncbi:hypothetical protein PMG11_00431 [Penicillium brasilianum]|uniref:Dimethylallyl tryptophan synthase n=1 Tax=Penicillium brasilianum TaxID=104259 RepID=A0A0F7TBY3_PENBI|nr:hypothetical protein PMG11_00431 [Penicillium brasilianum]
MDSDEEQVQPWQSLAMGLGFSSSDEEFWWTTFAQPLSRLMEWAKYPIFEQYRVLAFLHRYVIPSCGPRPYQTGEQFWKTFLSFDHTPIQLSINFYDSKATVRTSNVPICALSGSALDPINQKASIDTLNAQQHLAPGNDLHWFDHFTKAFFLPSDEAYLLTARVSDRILAMQAVQCILSYDFPYYATQTKQIGELIVTAIKELGDETADYMHSLGMLETFLDSGAAEKTGVSAAFLSFDTNLSDKYKSSRIKIYLATPRSAFNRLVDIFTLGGRLIGPEMERAIPALRLLWSSVMNIPEDISNDTDISPLNSHRCANFIFNFEIWAGAPFPTPKIYLPVAYYGKPDLEIAEGMDSFSKVRAGTSPSIHTERIMCCPVHGVNWKFSVLPGDFRQIGSTGTYSY